MPSSSSSSKRKPSPKSFHRSSGSRSGGGSSGQPESGSSSQQLPPFKRASVFLRLGTKAGAAGQEHRSTSPKGSLKPLERGSGSRPVSSSGPSSRVKERGRRDSPSFDSNWESWDERNLDHDDELLLEKKRQLLQQELARQGGSLLGQDKKLPSTSGIRITGDGMTKKSLSSTSSVGKAPIKKRPRDKSPSSSSSSSRRSSSSSNTDSSKSSDSESSSSDHGSGKKQRLKSMIETKVKSRRDLGEKSRRRSEKSKSKGKVRSRRSSADSKRKDSSSSLKKEKRQGSKPAMKTLSPDRHGNPRTATKGEIVTEVRTAPPMKQDKFGFFCAAPAISTAKSSVEVSRKRSLSSDRRSPGHKRPRSPLSSSRSRRRSDSPSPRSRDHHDHRRENSRERKESSQKSTYEYSRSRRGSGRGYSREASPAKKSKVSSSASMKRKDERSFRDDRSSRDDRRSYPRGGDNYPSRGHSPIPRDRRSSSAGRSRDDDRHLPQQRHRSQDREYESQRDRDMRKDSLTGRLSYKKDDRDKGDERYRSSRRSRDPPDYDSDRKRTALASRLSADRDEARGNRGLLRNYATSARGDRDFRDYENKNQRRKASPSRRSRSPYHRRPPSDEFPPNKRSRESSRSRERSSGGSRQDRRSRTPDYPPEKRRSRSRSTRKSLDRHSNATAEEFQGRKSRVEERNEIEDGETRDDECVNEEEGEVLDDHPRSLKGEKVDFSEKKTSIIPDTEAFSDIGESDDELLANPENTAEEIVGEESKEEKNTSGNNGNKDDADLLEGISDEDLDVSDGEEAKRTKAKVADALGVDWGQLISKQDEKPSSNEGAMKKRWSACEIFKRIGLSKAFFPSDEAYDSFISEINEEISDDSQKFKPLHPIAAIDTFQRKKMAEKQKLFTYFGPHHPCLTGRQDTILRKKILPSEPAIEKEKLPATEYDFKADALRILSQVSEPVH